MNTQTDPKIKAREILDNYLPLLSEKQIKSIQDIVDGHDETVNWMEFHSIWAWVDMQEQIQVALKKPVGQDTPNDPKGAAGALKSPLGLIPPVAMEQTAWVHKLGSEKYGPYNWRATGVCATTYVNAILRHLNAWRDGEDLDPESGISHIAHVACSCNILMDAAACGRLQDDRNKLK